MLSTSEIKAWKNSGLNGIWTHDLCNTSVMLHQLSSRNLRADDFWVRNIPMDGEEYKWI